MTLEERLERLNERHEALTQSVEILTHDVRELRAGIESLKAIAETSHASINGLARIAQSREHRITRLEGGEIMRARIEISSI